MVTFYCLHQRISPPSLFLRKANQGLVPVPVPVLKLVPVLKISEQTKQCREKATSAFDTTFVKASSEIPMGND